MTDLFRSPPQILNSFFFHIQLINDFNYMVEIPTFVLIAFLVNQFQFSLLHWLKILTRSTIGLIHLLESVITSLKFIRPAKNCTSPSEESFLITAAMMSTGVEKLRQNRSKNCRFWSTLVDFVGFLCRKCRLYTFSSVFDVRSVD